MFALEDPVAGEILSFGMHFGNLFTDLEFDNIIYYFITIKISNHPHTSCNFKSGIQIASAVTISVNICWETYSRLTSEADPGFLRPAIQRLFLSTYKL